MNKKYIITVADSDCTVEQYLFYGTEEDMLEVLKRKADEERREFAEYVENVTYVEYYKYDCSWRIYIKNDEDEILEIVTAKAVETMRYLDLDL